VLSKNTVRDSAQHVNVNYNFISIFNPSSIKNLTLYHRNLNSANSTSSIRGSFRNYKVLVKQSYLMAAWFSYYTNSTLKSKRIKGFATLPCRQSKHTAAKAPMAHKTYSQEQFIIKYYFLVFKTNTNEISKSSFSSIDKSLLIANIFSNISSFSGTNMLILYKVKLWYDSTDCSFFSYRIN
jgi:hypothetical protein